MRRFRGDLWNADRETIRAAAVEIMRQRGCEVRTVHRLGSGLYVTVELVNGNHVTIPDEAIRTFVWRATEVAA